MNSDTTTSEQTPRRHPYIDQPLLFISNIPPFVRDYDLVKEFVGVGPFKPKIERDASKNNASGEISFKFLDGAEKAYTILNGRSISGYSLYVPIVLSPFPPTEPPTIMAPTQAVPRLVKIPPPGLTDSQLYDVFRPFGPLASARAQMQHAPDVGMVEFWHEEDAIRAEAQLHFSENGGQNLTVRAFVLEARDLGFNILNAPLNNGITYDSLSQLSPVVRKGGKPCKHIHCDLSLNDDMLHYTEENEPMKSVETPVGAPSGSVYETISMDSQLAVSSDATRAPEHPTPHSTLASNCTESQVGLLPPASERDMVFAAVCKLVSTMQAELTDLIMSLPRWERALCLFNVDHMRLKLVSAKAVVESARTNEHRAVVCPEPVHSLTLRIKGNNTTPSLQDASQASSQASGRPSSGSSVAMISALDTPLNKATGPTHTLASLAQLPASEILRLACSPLTMSLPFPKADPVITQATDSFVDGLKDKPLHIQKQLLGEVLFKVVKSLGIKRAPKITVTLLDQENLRDLAHLMNSYQPVLKEKALSISRSQ